MQFHKKNGRKCTLEHFWHFGEFSDDTFNSNMYGTVINDIHEDEDSKQTELVTKDQDDDVNMFIKEDSISPLQLTVTQNSTNIMIDSSQSSRMLSQQAPYNDQSNDLDRVSLKLQRRKN